MNALHYAAVGLIALGVLMALNLFAPIPTCILGAFGICAFPLTVGGFNPNLVVGAALVVAGAFLFMKSRKEAEA